MKTIGIVGGVGPLAGIDLQRKIFSQTMAQRDQDHLDVIAVSFPRQIADRTAFLEGETAQNPAAAIARQFILLAGMGARIGAIPCNTAHAPRIFEAVCAEIEAAGCPITLLNMVDEVMRFLSAFDLAGPEIGLLATLGTYRSGLYQAALRRHGLTCLVPEPEGQRAVHACIYSDEYGVKSMGVNATARDKAREVVAGLKARGARAILLGCTELPPLLGAGAMDELPVIDPTLLLARAAIRHAAPQKLSPWKER